MTVGGQWQPDPARLRAPGLVVWGEADPYAGPEWGERLAKETGARFVRFDGCGHWWPLERPVEVVADIRTFWGGVPR